MTSREIVRAGRPAGKRSALAVRVARSARRAQARRAAHDRLVAEAMPHMVWTAHADGSIAYGNAALYAYTGIRVAKQFTLDWRSVVHCDDAETFAARWFAAAASAMPFECESRLRRAADGMYRWHVTRAVPVFAATGEVTSWIASCADIHDFKLASETRTILDTIGHIVTIVDASGACEYTSAGWAECFGTNDRGAALQLRDRVHPVDADVLARALARHEPVRQCELRLRDAAGAYRWFLCRTTVLDGPAHGVVCTLTDIDDFKRAQAAVTESETRYRALTDAMPQMVWIVDDYLHIQYVNERWTQFIGDRFAVGMQLDLGVIIHPDDMPRAQASYLRRLEAPSFELELRMRRHDGTYHWHLIRRVVLTDRVEGGRSWIITATDITARKSAEAELEHRASHDALTDLPTRAVLMDRLSHALDAARRTNSELLVVYLDIDHFKNVNDTLGHRAGDRLLLEVSARIRSVLRAGDTASRFGGDEFVLICAVENAARDAASIADRLAGVVRAPLMLDGKHIAVASSIGISRFPLDGRDAADLIQKADAAMYAAKKSGRNTYRAYETTHVCIPAALELEVELRAALERREFSVYYQPIMDLAHGVPAGAEALVRWNHPTRGILPPSEFIPFAEEYGLIVPLGEQVLATACAQIRALDLDPRDRFCVSVNVSAHQFARPDFAGSIAAAVAHYRIAPQHLELEITESVVMYGTSAAIGTFCELEANGVRLSIDDFGTGYCSLSYVKNFPLHTLKIDRAFVTDIAQNSTDQAIAKTIVTLAHSLRMRTIAEGVETPAQLETLRAYGVDCVQGYLLGRPMPAADFMRFLGTFAATRRPEANAAR